MTHYTGSIKVMADPQIEIHNINNITEAKYLTLTLDITILVNGAISIRRY